VRLQLTHIAPFGELICAALHFLSQYCFSWKEGLQTVIVSLQHKLNAACNASNSTAVQDVHMQNAEGTSEQPPSEPGIVAHKQNQNFGNAVLHAQNAAESKLPNAGVLAGNPGKTVTSDSASSSGVSTPPAPAPSLMEQHAEAPAEPEPMELGGEALELTRREHAKDTASLDSFDPMPLARQQQQTAKQVTSQNMEIDALPNVWTS
jgi:hypothetical protein